MLTITTDLDCRMWVGSLHLYNCGYLVGKWIDVDQWTDPDDATDDVIAYIEAHLPEGETLAEAIEELWCFDTEGLPGMGECSPWEFIKKTQELYEEVEESHLPADIYVAAVAEGLDPESVEPTGADTMSEAYEAYADESGAWDDAGTYAPYVDWEAFYRHDFAVYRLADTVCFVRH